MGEIGVIARNRRDRENQIPAMSAIPGDWGDLLTRRLRFFGRRSFPWRARLTHFNMVDQPLTAGVRTGDTGSSLELAAVGHAPGELDGVSRHRDRQVIVS